MSARKATTVAGELGELRNIGKAMLRDFELLGISSVQQLAKCDADRLYERIQSLTNTRHDPCVWDTYAAAIHQAKTGGSSAVVGLYKSEEAALLAPSDKREVGYRLEFRPNA